MVISCSHIAPGNYRANISAFAFTDMADKVELDKVESAFTFETVYDDMGKKEEHPHWFSDWRSNISLQPLEISEA